MAIKITPPTTSIIAKPHQMSASQTAAPANNRPSNTDSVAMTDRAAQLLRLEKAINQLPIADNKRIEETSLAVNAGRYDINPAQVADKLITLETSLNRARA